MKTILALALAVSWSGAAIANSQSTQDSRAEPVVVELFTSQGCSSCPPADAILHKLAERDDVLPLAFHVDYWDYIGWKDTFGSPAHTRRQKDYAHVAGRGMIYTPQLIVMGEKDVRGSDGMAVADAIAGYQTEIRPVELKIESQGNHLRVKIAPRVDLPEAPIEILVVRYSPRETVQISRGELAGQTMDYTNVVRSLDVVAAWNGQNPIGVSMEMEEDGKSAILVQVANGGKVLAAATLP